MAIAQESETLLCPHCGVTLDADEELCRSCGKLMIAYAAPRISFMTVFYGAIGSWFREALLHPDTDPLKIGEINPATGLPMENGVDVAGNVYGAGDD
jgi:hypothetical protein